MARQIWESVKPGFVQVATILCIVAGAAPGAHAGVPVIDVAAIAQAVKQVTAWKAQYDQMVTQIEQAKQQYESMTGTRNLGEILNDPALRESVPPDLAELYDSVHKGGLTGAAAALRSASRLYDCEDRDGDAQVQCRALLNQNAQSSALARNAYEKMTGRIDQIEALMKRINATDDPKSIAELQARLQVETAQVTNDANRIALLQQMSVLERDRAEQASRESVLRNFGLANEGLGR